MIKPRWGGAALAQIGKADNGNHASTPHNEQPAAEIDSVFWDDVGVVEISNTDPRQTARTLAKRGMREAEERLHRETLTPRMARAIRRLLREPCMREELDRVTGASNSPEVIRQIRGLGLDIHCQRVEKSDRDGLRTFPGRYSLAPESVPEALRLLGALDG